MNKEIHILLLYVVCTQPHLIIHVFVFIFQSDLLTQLQQIDFSW